MALSQRTVAVFAIAIVTALALTFPARDRIAPEARSVLISREAIQTMAREGLYIHPTLPLLSVGYREPSIVFAAGTNTLLLQGDSAARAAVPGQVALVDARERAAFEAGLSARGLSFAASGPPIAGHNYSNGEDVVLQAGRVAMLEETRG